MTLSSMTGFSRATGAIEGWSWTWELKSVNAKGLDVRVRLPAGLDALEIPARGAISDAFARGNVHANLQLNRSSSATATKVNPDTLAAVIKAAQQVQEAYPDVTAPSVDGLLNVRGVLETSDVEIEEDVRADLEKQILASLSVAVDLLVEMRQAEGENLTQPLSNLLTAMTELRIKAASSAEAQEGMIKEKLSRQVAQLIEDVDELSPGRLEQEAAVLMTKADVREELDRRSAHLDAVSVLMQGGGSVGRQLDFLCQELNREANTICSKAQNIELTQVGLDLKATIEQFREQVQNIE